jgi:3-methylcrotonyl-CoA carboxylase alpha subunit
VFKRILIANRGEIAARVVRTARRMGVETVAVFSDADAGARHVKVADRAVRLGPAAAADSYLRGDRVIEAALATGAEAIHPGYGFLSENPDFAEAVAQAGLLFIGPSGSAIRAMGLKDAAKAVMERAGVPVVPGYHGEDQSPGRLAVEAERIGYPVLVKAVAGGGGKGMRRVDRAEDFVEALAGRSGRRKGPSATTRCWWRSTCRAPGTSRCRCSATGPARSTCSSATARFTAPPEGDRRGAGAGDDRGDPYGHRHRCGAGGGGHRLCRAGTVEFIADASHGLRPDRFWFMEMNTRFAGRAPVTEAITGVDLVEWQLRVAAGEPLPLRQEELAIDGHAVEARLYAEDVAAGFLPATGTLTRLRFPRRARVDTGVLEGDAISPWYDPMIAKIICRGESREEAFAALGRALAGTQVAGCTTNLAFLSALVAHPDVRAGRLDTG